jgi:hypothetical protein
VCASNYDRMFNEETRARDEWVWLLWLLLFIHTWNKKCRKLLWCLKNKTRVSYWYYIMEQKHFMWLNWGPKKVEFQAKSPTWVESFELFYILWFLVRIS